MRRWRKSPGEKVFAVFNMAFMVVIIIIMLYPMIYILLASISDPYQLISHTGLILYPLGWNPSSYEKVLNNPMIQIGYLNTLIVVFVGTICNLAMSILCAYVLTRRRLMIKRVMSLMIVFTMFFQGGLIPTFLVVQGIGLVDKRWALIIPVLINTWNMIIMRTTFANFPNELEDAAKVDGTNDFTFLIKIMLPLCKPVIAVIALFYAVHHWNSWLTAVLYIRDKNLYPLQLVLREILIANDMSTMKVDTDIADNFAVAQTIKYATIIVSTVPILAIYPFVQKYFVKGVMVGAIKG